MDKHKHMLDFLLNLCWFPSREKTGKATNSEVRRWFERKSVEVNGERVAWSDPVPSEWVSLVLHPKGKHRTTLF